VEGATSTPSDPIAYRGFRGYVCPLAVSLRLPN
jgi:hypothetical protein